MNRVWDIVYLLLAIPLAFIFVSIAFVFWKALLIFAFAFGFFGFFFYVVPCATGMIGWREPLEVLRWKIGPIDVTGGDNFDKVMKNR